MPYTYWFDSSVGNYLVMRVYTIRVIRLFCSGRVRVSLSPRTEIHRQEKKYMVDAGRRSMKALKVGFTMCCSFN